MRRTNLLLFLAFLSILGYSCTFWGDCIEGEGPTVEKELQLKDFSIVDLSGSPTVYIKQGATQKVSIKAQANLIELLNKEVNQGEWDIQFNKCVNIKQKVEIFIEIPNIQELEINGSGEIISQGVLKAEKMGLEINGSGEIKVDLNAKNLESEIAGSGDIKIQGTTQNHEVDIQGSGDVDAFDLISERVKVDINGSGNVKVNVSSSLDVDINGSGDISYKGNVEKVNSDINGSGKIKRIN